MAEGKHGRGYFLILSLTALGVVFGDIGTSPLYALRESFAHLGLVPTAEDVLGILSLITWSLVLVVSIKYLAFVLRADNDGEGGMLALMALVHPEANDPRKVRRRRAALLMLGLFGAALLYGDGMITPAISVLSAVEGIKLAQPALSPLVVPITVVIIIGLFLLQRRGTAVIGTLFGPITLLWFLTMAALGIGGILRTPGVLGALNPVHGVLFFVNHGTAGFLVLGSVFLAVTGAEALYADMGHFGRKPIRVTWFFLVLPALLLNYYGQGALILADPTALENPFYRLAPAWGIIPLVVLATLATIIASQAIISGAFSLTMQAVQLGYWPRVEVKHTSEREMGQIYIPQINWGLMIATILLVLYFGSSSRLAAAYGVAVATDMVITSLLFYVVARERWGWKRLPARLLVGAFLVFELAFWSANIVKVPQGGWLPLAVAGGVLTLMLTWREGRRILATRLRDTSKPILVFIQDIQRRGATRVRGHAVYMTGNSNVAPPALVKNLEHNRVLHMRVALMSITTEDVPHVPPAQRVAVEDLGAGFTRVVAKYGFMDEPNAVEVLSHMRGRGVDFPLEDTTFFLGRERLISTTRPGMSPWREKLFAYMSRNAQQATSYFRIPPDRVIEVGSQIEL